LLHAKRILVVVPARGGSKGMKMKNIQPINGVPLVALVGKVVKQLSYVDRTVVSTDHTEIARIAKKSGMDVPFMRPEFISGDIVSDWDILNHALLATEENDHKVYDIIVMLQPTSPLRKPEHVTQTVKKLIEGNYDAVWTISPTDSKSHPLKQLTFENDTLYYFDKCGEEIIARQQLSTVYHRNGACYAITRDCILTQKTIKGKKSSAVIIDDPMISIDTELDLRKAELLLQRVRT